MKIKKYFIITLGIMMVAFAISVFYTPNKIVSGGVSGISTILFHTVGIEPGISFAVINIVLLTIAYIFMGKKFVANTIFGAVLLSLFVQIFSYIKPITNDMLLATVFGAVLYGIGIGLTLIEGASTAGTDILSRLNNQKFITSGVANTIPKLLQIIMWELINNLPVDSRDYLQVLLFDK